MTDGILSRAAFDRLLAAVEAIDGRLPVVEPAAPPTEASSPAPLLRAGRAIAAAAVDPPAKLKSSDNGFTCATDSRATDTLCTLRACVVGTSHSISIIDSA